MVEVPATALKAAAFAPHVDVFSIGTNDLSQYALAAERGNDAVADVADPFDPGCCASWTLPAGEQAPVAVCGELAADERTCALLLGFGVRELSVAPGAIPVIKQAVRGIDSRARRDRPCRRERRRRPRTPRRASSRSAAVILSTGQPCGVERGDEVCACAGEPSADPARTQRTPPRHLPARDTPSPR